MVLYMVFGFTVTALLMGKVSAETEDTNGLSNEPDQSVRLIHCGAAKHESPFSDQLYAPFDSVVLNFYPAYSTPTSAVRTVFCHASTRQFRPY